MIYNGPFIFRLKLYSKLMNSSKEILQKSIKLFLVLFVIAIILFFIRNCVLTEDYSREVIIHFLIVSLLFIAPPLFIISVVCIYVYNKLTTKQT